MKPTSSVWERECVLFIGTQFSILYTSMYSLAKHVVIWDQCNLWGLVKTCGNMVLVQSVVSNKNHLSICESLPNVSFLRSKWPPCSSDLPKERVGDWGGPATFWSLLCVAETRATRPNIEQGYSTCRHMLGHECPGAVSPARGVVLTDLQSSI